MKFKHHLSEEKHGSLHFFLRLVSVTLGLLSSLLTLLWDPPSHPHTVHRLFTIHVLNKNEVKVVPGLQIMQNGNKFCEGERNKE